MPRPRQPRQPVTPMVKESPVLYCPKCKRAVDYILAQVGGKAAYQPCGHAAGRATR